MIRHSVFGMAAAAAAAVLFLFSACPLQAGTIYLVPSSTNVDLGKPFGLDLIAHDLNLGGYELQFQFNAGLVEITGTNPGLSLGDSSLFESFFTSVIGLDNVQLTQVSLLDSPTLLLLQGTAPGNSILLAHFTVNPIAPGTAAFSFSNSHSLLTGVDANPLAAELIGANVTIGAASPPPDVPGVPEPASWLLTSAGALLIGIGLLRRRERTKQ